MHTYIVIFEEHPETLVYDMRAGAVRADSITSNETTKEAGEKRGKGVKGSQKGSPEAGLYRRFDAPLLQDVVAAPQSL